MSKVDPWRWETTDPFTSGTSGDLSKLFRNEEIKHPGHLAKHAPSSGATLLARELIQNSRDASVERRRSDNGAPPFKVDFDFRALDGEARQSLVTTLGLEFLASRATVDRRATLGLGKFDSLTDLDSDELKCLYVSETGTTGMYGPFTGAKSKMYLALVSVGYTAKAKGSGGSYGYGKAGLIRSSAIRTIVAYSCFAPRDDDRVEGTPVTRRLLGMTYWGQHAFGDTNFTGFARFGQSVDGDDARVEPFVNEAADAMAHKLGMELRDPEDPNGLGTTYLVLDPTVDPGDLNTAIERNWWPAIMSRELFTVVSAYDGTSHTPRPRANKDLSHYVRAWEIATTPQDNNKAEERQCKFQSVEIAGQKLEGGTLGLKADLDGFSWPAVLDDDAQRDKSLVALVRGPGMVVEYLDVGANVPLVRGVYVAPEGEPDDLLRQTEPKAHDAWQARLNQDDLETGISPIAPQYAEKILRRIRQNVQQFRKRLKPPAQKPEDVRLPLLRELFSDLLSGAGQGGTKKPAPAPAPPRDVLISVKSDLEPAGSTEIRATGTVTYRLSERLEEPTPVNLAISYRFIEDGRLSPPWPLTLQLPKEATERENGKFSMVLGHEAVVVSFVTDPYSSDWSAQLSAEGETASGAADPATATEGAQA